MENSTSLKEDERERISELCAQLIASYHVKYGFGSMTCNVYDTAWVAIVTKVVDGSPCYLFPSCLDYVLDSQLSSGGWSTTPSDDTRGVGVSEVVSTLAALFALITISRRPCQIAESKVAKARIAAENAALYLSENLQSWNVAKSREVGFEYLVPALLELVENQGYSFSFPQKEALVDLRRQKMSKFRYEYLYGSKKSSVLHSAEVFFGDPNMSFDSIKHHKVHGSIMASPSATAAYIMRASTWDNEAEDYLRHVMEFGAGNGSGGMPSAFPTTYFELIWAMSTLISAGLSTEALRNGKMKELYTIIRDEVSKNGGLIGFASDIEPDLDDTAQASIIFSKMGESGLSKTMGKYFSGSGHLQTYQGERHPSFSANCNALYAILLEDAEDIPKATTSGLVEFLCKTWWEAELSPPDKWNFSPFYSYMLISRTFMALVEKWDEAHTDKWAFNPVTGESVSLVLLQCLVRTLRTQHDDGHWGDLGSKEETAYAILTLTSLKSFSVAKTFEEQIDHAIKQGREHLRGSDSGEQPEQIWIEKTTYGSHFVAEAYIVAALNAQPRQESVGKCTGTESDKNEKHMIMYTKLVSMVPLFKDCPRWLIQMSWLEGQLYLKMLMRQRAVVFTRKGMTEDKYFAMIPFLWTCVNNLNATFLASTFIFSMMTISFLNFQADEFMEVAVGAECSNDLDRVRDGVREVFSSLGKDLTHGDGIKDSPAHSNDSKQQVNGEASQESASEGTKDIVAKALITLREFAKYILSYPEIARASLTSRTRLCRKIEDFLLAHIDQVEASNIFSHQDRHYKSPDGTVVFQDCRLSFSQWLHTISAEHTSCPYSFEFALCLWESLEGQSPGSVADRYVAEDLCQRLAIICRLYNDLGSIRRDREEWNLNSVNFPEFHDSYNGPISTDGTGSAPPGAEPAVPPDADAGVKQELQRTADYERKHLQLAMSELERTVCPEMMGMVKVFVNITDLFGQIYIVKDLASQRT